MCTMIELRHSMTLEHEAEEPRPAHVASVSVKLPPFWPADTQLWLA